MNYTYVKRAIAVIMTILIIAVLFYAYLPPQVNIVDSMNETVGVNKVDVLCVGSSHLYSGINPKQMFEDKGIVAYDIAIGSQSPWQSYYYIEEACKKQKPKMIIFDTYMVGSAIPEDYQDYQTVSNLLDTPISIGKIRCVLESRADSKLNILLRFPYVYDDYEKFATLTIDKIYGETDNSFGYKRNDKIEPYYDVTDVSDVVEVEPLDEKNEKYLRRIIEYCKENDIIIVLAHTPWPCITEEAQERFNRVGEIANEYQIDFLDGCKYCQEIGMDYSTDTYDGSHLNYFGVTKYTAWVEKYLSEHYSLPDRRNEIGYEMYRNGS